MASVQSNWEDDENNRRVELNVEYQLEDGRLEITAVTPTSVCFVDGQAGVAKRSVGVWTETGRSMLVNHATQAGHLSKIHTELEAAHTVQLGNTSQPGAAADIAVSALTA